MKKKHPNKKQPKPKAEGYVRLIIGILLIICVIASAIALVSSEMKKPKDAEYFKGEVSKVISVEEHHDLKKKAGSKWAVKTKVYDCNVIIEYAVNGQIYKYNYVARDNKTAIKEGNTFYVEVSPRSPQKVYAISATDNPIMNSEAIYYICDGIFGIVSIILIVTGLKAVKEGKKIHNNPQL